MKRIAELKEENEQLKLRNNELEEKATKLETRATRLEAFNAQLIEELKLALYRLWSRTSEKFIGQNDLPFEDLKPLETPETIEQEIEEKHEARRKSGRKPLAENLPRVEHYHDLTEEEKVCACGHKMEKIGEDINEKLNMIPVQVWVERHHYSKYACSHCQGLTDETKPGVITAKSEDLIPRSIATAGVLAQIFTSKFADHLPYYRQEAGFQRIGADISRQDMVNWTMKIANQVEPLISLIEERLKEGPIIQMDETPVQVLDRGNSGSPGKGYMWLARGGPEGKRAIRYKYATGRGSIYAKTMLTGFEGYLQSDGYAGYDLALKDEDKITHVGCWAHVRRRFNDAEKASGSEVNRDALGRIKKLYQLDNEYRGTDQEKRKEIVGGYLKELKKCLEDKSNNTAPSGATGKALSYTLGQWSKLVKFIDHEELTPDNNGAENAIRPFVVGRKNWLFCGNDKGAEASSRIYSLIETAKMNNLEPYAYLKMLLEKLPSVRNTENWESLLPWNMTLA